MIIHVKREAREKEYTIGDLYVNDKLFCNTLEDTDRGLLKSNDIEDIKSKKVKGKTAIPAGTYLVTITYSNRFKKNMPLVEGVPGFEGIRIHSGNTAADTEGCILVGKNTQKGKVLESKATFDSLFAKIRDAFEMKETIYITIE